MQRRGKHTSVTKQELLKKVFSVGSAPRLYEEDPRLAEEGEEDLSCGETTSGSSIMTMRQLMHRY
jgi:hypothetical protein